jgi:hypothetical protein
MFKAGESGNLNGRPVGVGNKTTNQIKEAYQKLLEDNLDNMSQWLGKIADKDPAKATELMLKLSEYILPKLARQEVVGNDGEDLFKNVSFTFSTADKQQDGKEE